MGSLVSTVVSLGVVPYLTVLYTPSWPTDDGLLQLCGVLMLCSAFDGFFLILISVCVDEALHNVLQTLNCLWTQLMRTCIMYRDTEQA